MESSWTRDRISVPCIGKQVLDHWTTREIPSLLLKLAPKCIQSHYLSLFLLYFPEKGVASVGNLGVSLLMYLSQLAYQSISP